MSLNDPYGRPRPQPGGAATGWVVGGMLALLLIAGILVWGGSSDGVNTAANTPDVPATVGSATTGSGAATPPLTPRPSTTGSGTR